jgi:GNAT superfamily N-acetyltransferase
VAPDDPIGGWLAGLGFEPYAETVRYARPAEGVGAAPPVPGVEVTTYRNDWAEAFGAAEAAAMEGLAAYREIGAPTGYEGAAGMDHFTVAWQGGDVVGFCQTSLPDGWINWLGVVPEARRRGVGTLLLAEAARDVRAARGTHLAAEVEARTVGTAFLAARGFRERGRRLLLIRRA